MAVNCAIIGIGQTKYSATRDDLSIPGLVREAALRALADANMTWDDIDCVVLGKAPDFFEGVMMPELFLADALGAQNKPMLRVHTAGSVGGSTAVAAASHVMSGKYKRVLTVTFQKQSESNAMWALSPAMPFQPPMLSGAGGYFSPIIRSYMKMSGAEANIGHKVAVKDRLHALKNPLAHLHMPDITEEQVAASPILWDPTTYLETCPSSDGACAMVLVDDEGADAYDGPVAWVRGMALGSEPVMFAGRDIVNPRASVECAQEVYRQTGVTDPLKDFDMAEIYVPFSWFEPIWIESLGFARPGEGWKLVADGTTSEGGACPWNMSGGVLSTNPIGASGMIRFAEAALQVRGQAGEHQVPDAKLALGHAYGGGNQFFAMWAVGSEKPDEVPAYRRRRRRKKPTFNLMDLYEVVSDHIPDKEALVCEDTRLTYRELDDKANQVAHYFESIGLGAGDHIGLYMYNCAEYVIATMAALKIRAVPFNINYRWVADEIEYIQNYADLKAILFHTRYAEILKEVKGRGAVADHYIALKDTEEHDLSGLDAVDYDDATYRQPFARDFKPRSGDDIFVVCTGGTTGFPKGVMWRHEDLFFAALQGGRSGGDPIDTPDEIGPIAETGDEAWTLYAAPPFIHGTAIYSALITFFAGGKVVISKAPSYNAQVMTELIEKEQMEVLVMVGDAMLLPFIKELERRGVENVDLESLSVITSQGAIMSDSTLEKLESFLPGMMVMNNFGATEAGHQGQAVVDDKPLAEGETRRTRFTLDEYGALIDDDLKIVEPKPGATGRIGRKGRVPLGYYKDEEKTAATFFEIDGERWAIPGDHGEYDEDGLVVLLGRGSNCINTGGEKVYPEEVEEALKGHPDVYDALVVGLADEQWMQRVTAVIQPEQGAELSVTALDEFMSGKVAGYKKPREWHIVETVPRQENGKPNYKEAKAIAEAGDHKRE